MNADETSQASRTNSASGTRQKSSWLLVFGLTAAPFAWSVAELVLYGIASFTCRLKPSGSGEALAFGGSWWLWAVFVITLVIAIAGCAAATSNWRKARGDNGGPGPGRSGLGEIRSRFLAACGLLTSTGFLVGFVFLLNTLVAAPLCAK